MVSLASYVVGTVLPASPQKQAKGFFGYKGHRFLLLIQSSACSSLYMKHPQDSENCQVDKLLFEKRDSLDQLEDLT